MVKVSQDGALFSNFMTHITEARFKMYIEHALERESFCQYLSQLIKERGLSLEELSRKTGMCPVKLKILLEGSIPPLLDELIRICDQLQLKITIQSFLPFDHQKITNRLVNS